MRVMGVVNVTPDSFVGEVRTPTVRGAVQRCLQLAAEGAAIIDVGGESTRPGSSSIALDEELTRVMPVIEALVPVLDPSVQISIDTQKEQVARAAIGAGAHIVNDMSSSLAHVAGELSCGYVAAHMLGSPATMQDNPTYVDVIGEILAEVTAAGHRAVQAGATQVWIDPGIGFGKTIDHNLSLLAQIDRFVDSGLPVLVGVSRKGFIGRLHAASDVGGFADMGRWVDPNAGCHGHRTLRSRGDSGHSDGSALRDASPTSTEDRLEASVAMATWSALLGVDVVRVHDVSATVAAFRAL